MNVEEKIKECESILKQIKQFEPDPYYINYFFKLYLTTINKVYEGIFEEANRDFGLFISNYSINEFLKKAKIKNDQKAIEFALWFQKKYDEEHKNSYPNFIKESCQLQKENKKLPKIKIMIRANERYDKDPNQELVINLKDEKIKSKDELHIEIKRQSLIFLEVINFKRSNNKEPKISEDQITVSTFLDINQNGEYVEIAYASEIYILVLKRFLEEIRNKIREFTAWS